MSITICEYLGYDFNNINKPVKDHSNFTITESAGVNSIAPGSLMVDIEGLHVGPTRNFTRYSEQALKSSVPSWTKPYLRPMIMHHNEKDGKIIGRIRNVYYTDVNTLSGTGALVFTVNIPDEEGKQQIKDGRLLTVSVGVIAHDVRCSICGHNVAQEGLCEHERGSVYNGQVCYWDIYEMEGKELSYVIVPSDIYARNIKIYEPSTTDLKENHDKGVLVLKPTGVDCQENLQSQESQILDNKDTAQTSVDETVTEPAENNIAPSNDIASSEPTNTAAEEKTSDSDKSEEDLKAENEKLKAQLKQTLNSLDEAQKALNKAKEDLTLKEAAVIQEKQLREQVEAKLIELNAQLKESLIDNYMLLRKITKKPEIKVEELRERTEMSLRDAIKDLKEEFELNITEQIGQVKSPILVNEKDENVKTDIKEKKNIGNIDLAEELQNIFNFATSKHKHI